MKKHYRSENNCLNCGTTLQGHYCHNCGQENLELKENFVHMMEHTVSDYFHFDHLFFHTLKPLLFKPGYLTVEYMAGRRAQYLHPVKMYIFISIVYFLIAFNLVPSGNGIVRFKEGAPDKTVIIKEEKRISADTTINPHTKQVLIAHLKENDTSYAQYLNGQRKLPEKMRDGFWANLLNKRVFGYKEKYGKRAFEQFAEDVQHNIPKMMFVLLPLTALQLTIAFRKNKKFYVEHLIFTFHYFCFCFLFLAFVNIIEWLMPVFWSPIIPWLGVAEMVIVLLYLYMALRAVYHRSRFRTATKTAGISVANFAISLICLAAVVGITALIAR
ncbi:MAG: DUF3667 domain-containing protein [Mucilaginibacter sp.]